MIKLTVEVKRIHYINENINLYIFDGITKRKKLNSMGKEVTAKVTENFAGTFMSLYPGDVIEVTGDFIFTSGYGEQFKVDSYVKILPNTIKTIEDFLDSHIKGLGKGRIKALTDAYKEDTLSIIAKDIKALDILPHCSESKKKEIYKHIADNIVFEKLITFLQASGLESSYALKIWKEYDTNSMYAVKETPYTLCMLNVMPLHAAEKLAYAINLSGNDAHRVRAGVVEYLKAEANNKGNTFVYLESFLKQFNSFMSTDSVYKDTFIDAEEIMAQIANLENERKVVFNNNDKTIYLSSLYNIEKGLAHFINEKIKAPFILRGLDEDIIKAIDQAGEELGITLHEKQKKAILEALTHPISIITGGPGTGKTQTITALLKTLSILSPDVKINLCSPTGKAAKRMSELSGMEASTIHKLFKIYSSDIETDEVSTVNGDFLIVDEASLIDVKTFYKLFKGLGAYTQLLIIGDSNQLPSVGPGQVFKDMIDSGKIKVTTLTHIFRQASESLIVRNAHKIINGAKPEDLSITNAKGSDFYFFSSDEEALPQTVCSIFGSLLSLRDISDIQILSPSKNTSVGTVALNQMIQATYGKGGISIKAKEMQFFEGDKVIHTRNNYDLNVFNGETGIVKKINALEQSLTVDFGDKEIIYDRNSIDELNLAYDITIHKSQGSEFPIVIIPITKGNHKMLSKSLIYTGISRAKEKVILVGNKECFAQGLETELKGRRNSKIKELLISLQQQLKEAETE